MRVKKQLLIALSFFSVLSGHTVFSQSLPDSTIKKIDGLFSKWNNPSTPGYAIGVVRNDSLIYAKGYGSANLEYGIPITPATIFHMASVSKQFTAWSIVLLARQGKLGLDDDIRKYLTWFPELKEKITIRNLLNHTSGIRDQWQLLAIAGTRIDDVITQEHIVKILSAQQRLNFKPGARYTYSNSGFTMLAEIVKAVSGQTLRKFTDSAIFRPLGMNHTHFHDDYQEIEKDRAYSYFKDDSGHYENLILSYSNAGATSLFTNVNDMSKWVMNFYEHRSGDQKDVDELTRKGKLNDGSESDYALGISVDEYRGKKRYSHSGGDAGYRTFVEVFPDLKMGFIVFSNDANGSPGRRVEEITNLFIADENKKSPSGDTKKDSSAAILKETQSIAKYSGDYISEDGVRFSYAVKNKKMYWIPNDDSLLLIKISKDSFALFSDPTVRFAFSSTGKDTVVDEYWPHNHRLLAKYTADTTPSDELLRSCTGTYYSPELDCKYGIELKAHHLWLTNDKYSDTRLNLFAGKHLFSDYWWMNHLVLLKDGQDKITGFEVNSGRIMHLLFRKIQ